MRSGAGIPLKESRNGEAVNVEDVLARRRLVLKDVYSGRAFSRYIVLARLISKCEHIADSRSYWT